MLYSNLQVLFCTEIAVEKHFDLPKCDFWGPKKKNFLGSLSLAIFYGPLVNYAVIRRLNIMILCRLSAFLLLKPTVQYSSLQVRRRSGLCLSACVNDIPRTMFCL